MFELLSGVWGKITGKLSSLRSLAVAGDVLMTEGFESDAGWTHKVKVFPVGKPPYETDIGNIFTPANWLFWFKHEPGTWDQPEAGYFWLYQDKRRVRTGNGSYRWFSFYRKHDAGLMRSVAVTPGQRVRLTAHFHAWSNGLSDEQGGHLDNAGWSDGDPLVGFRIVSLTEAQIPPLNGMPQNDAIGNMLSVVGLDPLGGTDPFAPSVVWGEPRFAYNGYGEFPPLAVEAVAEAGTVTVFLRNRGLWPFKHSDIYTDDVSLVVVEDVVPDDPEPEEPPVEPPVEPEPTGFPRIDYARTYVLIPQQPELRWCLDTTAKSPAAKRHLWTVGHSADDAGMGPTLTVRRVVAVASDMWPSSLSAFYDEYYSGVELFEIPLPANEYTLNGGLLAAELYHEGLRVGYPTTHLPPRITSEFGVWRDTYHHGGLDLASSYTEWGDIILSATAGQVIEAKWSDTFGLYVLVRTVLASGRIINLRYAHLSTLWVDAGEQVTRGQEIGLPGSTGESTGDHLHFSIEGSNGEYANPALLILWPGEEEEPEPEPEPEEPPEVEDPPVTVRSSKLGPHVLVAAPDVGELSMKAAIIKQVDAFSVNVNPAALLIGRHYQAFPDAQAQRNAGLLPEAAALEFVNLQRDQYLRNPHIKYWEGHNEPVWSTATEMGWYARFEHERMRLMAEMGLKCVIGNFATGCPPLELWPAFQPAIEAGMEYQAILGLHEYSCPWMWWMTGGYQLDPNEDEGDEGWTTLRYRKVYRQYLIPNGTVIPLAITECGLDPLVNPKPLGCDGGTWSQLGPYWEANPDSLIPYTGDKASYYAAQLEWYAKELQKDPYIVGATIFCMGNFGGTWVDFDIAGTEVATRLIQYASENPCPPFNWHDYAGEYEQPEDPPTTSAVPIGVHMAPILAPPTDQVFWLAELKRLGVTTVKLLDAVSAGNLEWIARLRGAGIRPIVRLYKAQQFPNRLDSELVERVSSLVAAGATYVEIGNEPNLACEWKDGYVVDWHNAALVAAVASSWYADAAAVIARGGRPAFYAMAPTDRGGTNQLYSSVEWQRGIIGWLAENRYQQVRDWIASGKVWLAVHSSPFSRTLDYDPWTIPDDMCMRGYQVHQAIVEEAFGIVPETISTESGTFSPEHMVDLGWETYPGGLPLTEANYAACTAAMYRWAATRDLPVCTWILTDLDVQDLRWKDAGWYRGTTPREVVTALANRR